MSERKRAILTPGYMKNFKCIGSACEDSCCVGWRVDIDCETYKKYQRVKDEELTPLLDKNITRNRASNHGDGNYAKLKLSSDGRCPFLNDERLCKIQLKRGEEYLSDVCTTYPRITNIVNDVLERSATISCPEAAKLALLIPEGMEFDELEEDVSVKNIVCANIDTHIPKNSKRAVKYLWEIRVFTIFALQNRSYLLWERLIIIGMFFQKIQQLVEDEGADDIPGLIATYTNIMEEGSIKDSLNNIPTQNSIQMQLLKEIAEKRYFMGVRNIRYLECLSEFLIGIEYVTGAKIEEIGQRYETACNEYYEPFMKEHEYILENYLVNYVFKNLFPFGEDKSLFDAYMMLVLHYALIKMHLIGMSAFHKGLTEELIIKLIQSFSKTIEHDQQFINGIADLMLQNKYNTMAYMAILIKN